MENASKALVIAGGMLLAMLIIGLIIVVSNNMSEAQRNQDMVKSAEQVTKFNLQFESYNKKSLRGVDIISICNKADDYNERESDNTSKGYGAITISVNMKIGNENIKLRNQVEFIDFYNNKLEAKGVTQSGFKQFYFQCIGTDGSNGITYDNETGRVISMHFERVMEK